MTVAASNQQSKTLSALQTTSSSYEMIEDPNLQTGVELYTHGDSDEFNASHVITGEITGNVNLTWTHIAGTELQLTQLPDIWDFCYFTVSFPWELERVPTDAIFRFSYGVSTKGDFNSTEGQLMFNVHSWLIDSSDNWEPLLESEPPYTTTTRLYTYDLNYFDLTDGWRGMVEDATGIQEDPEDVLQIGVGLAPSESFESYDDSHPWQDYNGSVTALVNTLGLEVLLEPLETDFVIEPYYVVGLPVLFIAVIIAYLAWRRSERRNA